MFDDGWLYLINKLIVLVVVGRDDNVDSFSAANGSVFK